MLPIKSWRIFYADGSTFTSNDGTLAEAPPFGVMCRVDYHVDGKKTLSHPNEDGILYYEGEDDLKGYKMGMWMDSEGYYRVMDLARKSFEP
jgi:hypothetical protein